VTPPLLTNLLSPNSSCVVVKKCPQLWPPKCAPLSVLSPIAGNTRN
jgi:hypothetical protein